jgi:hypothetical protein
MSALTSQRMMFKCLRNLPQSWRQTAITKCISGSDDIFVLIYVVVNYSCMKRNYNLLVGCLWCLRVLLGTCIEVTRVWQVVGVCGSAWWRSRNTGRMLMKFHAYVLLLGLHQNRTRWFKYDRDKLWLVYTQTVPVIFEPPCTSNFLQSALTSQIHEVGATAAPLLKFRDLRK